MTGVESRDWGLVVGLNGRAFRGECRLITFKGVQVRVRLQALMAWGLGISFFSGSKSDTF